MLNIATKDTREDAISMLKHDHATVKDLFEKFENAQSLAEKRKICAKTIEELKIHAEIEEKIFYPAVRDLAGKEIMTEADEEHHVAKVLIAELEEMDGKEAHFAAKYKVLSENVRHHIKEEEGVMFPKVKVSSDELEAIGQQMTKLKTRLQNEGVAISAEEKMVALIKGKGDSPARASGKL